MAKLPFIGTEALKQLAISITPEIAMSGYYDRKAIFDKFQINVVSGIQFKDVKYEMLRAGHTTRVKKVGSTLRNTVGKLIERELTTYLVWNRYQDNMDSYRELPVLAGDDNASATYPNSELALRAILANYSEDLYDNFWHGNHANAADNADGSENANAHLGLYDGIFTNLAKAVTEGYIKPVAMSGYSLAAPVDTTDLQAWEAFKHFRMSWDIHLQQAPKVIVAMNEVTAMAIVDAYCNSKANQKEPNFLPNGNISFPIWPNIEIAYDASVGVGSKMLAYVPNVLEYGIDTQNADNDINVQVGSDNDAHDIFFQVQSAQGTRIARVSASAIACSDDSIAPFSISGDRVARVDFVVNDATMGHITVGGETLETAELYKQGTTLTVEAVAADGFTFVKWADGTSTASRSIVTSGEPQCFVAIFKAE